MYVNVVIIFFMWLSLDWFIINNDQIEKSMFFKQFCDKGIKNIMNGLYSIA